MTSKTWVVPSADHMAECAAHLMLAWPTQLGRAWILGLIGPLGAGKTTLVKAIGASIGITDITSPTFDLIHTHWGLDGIRLVHIDLYRLTSEAAVLGLDLDYYWDDPNSLIVVEWPDRLPNGYNLDHTCNVAMQGSGRLVTFTS